MKKTNEEFLKQVKTIHGDKIDFSKMVYTWRRGKVDVKCNICGHEWAPRADSLLNGYGCPVCAIKMIAEKNKMTNKTFIEEAQKTHGEKYDYSLVDMTNRREDGKVGIICPEHGIFWMLPSEHIKSHGHGCPECGHYVTPSKIVPNVRKTTEQFANELLDLGITDIECYSEYISNKKPMCFKCKKCGLVFSNRPVNIIYNNERCPECGSPSKLETEVGDFLREKNIAYEKEYTYSDLKGDKNCMLRYDFYLPEHHVLIECQGRQHFIKVDNWGGQKQLEKQQKYDKMKAEYAKIHGIKLLYYSNIHIKYPYKVYEDKNELLKEIIHK